MSATNEQQAIAKNGHLIRLLANIVRDYDITDRVEQVLILKAVIEELAREDK